MDSYKLVYDASTIRPITHIDFTVLGNDEIGRMSALAGTHGIDIPDLYDKHEPKRGGLLDPRLGGSNNTLCVTCQLDEKNCDGHFGHIDLAEPVFHIGFRQYLKNILECICIGCSNILIPKETDKIKQILSIKSSRNRLAKVHSMASKVKNCMRDNQGCGIQVSKIKIDIKKKANIIEVYSEVDVPEDAQNTKKKQRLQLSPDMIADILDNISEEDQMILGMDPKKSRPSDMIHKIFPVPPVHVRPSCRGAFTSGSSVEDGLTHKLGDIIKANSRMNKNKGDANENVSKYSKDHQQLLQFHIAAYFDQDVISNPKGDGKGAQFKPIVARYKGKEGRVRGNLMGKRGDFNARTVITSDPTISNNQLGVPVKIAMSVTFPEIVTPFNLEEMTRLVRNGPDKYPGANFVFKSNQMVSGNRVRPIYLKFRKEEVTLQYGDVVERHLQNDDMVLLNRQPSLHKHSMMGHMIKVINDPSLITFRLSAAVCNPYNADFDGDEMNIFIPQSVHTRIELEEIADVKKQIITPSTSKTIIGLVQDGLLGAYNMTHDLMRIDWRSAMNIVSYTTYEKMDMIKKDRDISGKELFSLIIPPKINIHTSDFDLKNGHILRGRVGKSLLGSKQRNNLLQLVWDEYGEDACRDFIDNTQRLVNNFNFWNGFTVGIGDAFIPKKIKNEIELYIDTVVNRINIDVTHMENNPGYMEKSIFERKIFNNMNVILSDVSKTVIGNIPDMNGFNIMYQSGSKGGATNLGQIIGCVGLQAFEGSLFSKRYANRTIAYFHENEDSAFSRGLVKSSYCDGLTFPEYIYHSSASREGTIDQVVKTSETGYAQRKLVKTMEDVMVCYDGTVRIANNQIIQYVYGGNGFDTTKQYQYRIKMYNMNNLKLEESILFTDDELIHYKDFSKADNKLLYQHIKRMRDQLRSDAMRSKMKYIVTDDNYMLSINLTRIVSDFVANDSSVEKISPKYIILKLEQLLSIESTALIRVSAEMKKNKYVVDDEYIAKNIMRVALYDALHPKIINEVYHMTIRDFDRITENIREIYNNNLIEPGEMIGVVSAQSLGEAVTQMTLNSVDWKERLIYRVDGIEVDEEIGRMIDRYMTANKEIVQYMGNNLENNMEAVQYLDIMTLNMEVRSVDSEGLIRWNRITALTKHLPINADGTSTLIRVLTRSGKTVMATKGKSFLTSINGMILPIRGDELKIWTMLPIMNHIDQFEDVIGNVRMDPVISIEEVEPTNTHVYDLTVENDLTFVMQNGLCMMDSFHHAGIASKTHSTTGVPRITELIGASKNPKSPQMFIYLTKDRRETHAIAHKIGSYLEKTTFGDIRSSLNVYYDPNPKKEGGFMERDGVDSPFYNKKLKLSRTNCTASIDNLPWLIRIEMNREKMMETDITLLDISAKFCMWWDNKHVNAKKKNEKITSLRNITSFAMLSNSNNDPTPIIHIRFNVKDVDKSTGKKNKESYFNRNTIIDFIELIDKFKLKGVDYIESVNSILKEAVTDIEDRDSMKLTNEYVIGTSGVNMKEIRNIMGIDLYRTYSDNVQAMFITFGIEIARNRMITELLKAYEDAGHNVNSQHVALLVDIMCNDGTVISADRHGMKKSDIDPLSKASFEKTIEVLTGAAVFGDTDRMNGVSSRIMAGQVIKGGTGYCELLLDVDMIQNSEYSESIEDTMVHKTSIATAIVKDAEESGEHIYIPE